MKLVAFTLWLFLIGGSLTPTKSGGIAKSEVLQSSSMASVSGRVLDPFGIPVPKVRVEISGENQTQPLYAVTDEKGYYKLNDVSLGQHIIVVSSSGFITERSTVILQKSESLELNFGLVAGYLGEAIPIQVSGTVRQKDNTPLQDATVTIANAFSKWLVTKVETDKKGRYDAVVNYPGQYIVYASKPGFIVNATTIVLPASLPRKRQTVNLVLVPPPSGSIYGVSR